MAGRLLNASRPALKLRLECHVEGTDKKTDKEETCNYQIRDDGTFELPPPADIWQQYCCTLRDYAVVVLLFACDCSTRARAIYAAYERMSSIIQPDSSVQPESYAHGYWSVEAPGGQLCSFHDLLLHTRHVVIVAPWSNENACVALSPGCSTTSPV